MKMKFCKACGTIYDPHAGPCPKCAERELLENRAEALAYDETMPEEAVRKARTKAWVQIIIGVPAMIGIFYLVFYLAKQLQA
ncbi:hypothetical protein SDC9_189173 [bioreactor metagenome]|uniref:Uncharacterized protein n=1 Tax=bioreactor metagenome TaxID=1076179 RepID=A0A645HTU3_9ZZZZ|nr:hypothetical protein [Candidatus Pelethousia sp.]NCB30250.1 hypothetical protein [Clostridia bacterium]